jgi:hypothetical protein
MEARGYRQCVAANGETRLERAPLVDFSAGQFRRGIDLLPKQGAKPQWRWRRSYARDFLALKFGRLEDGALRFSRAPTAQGRSAAK